MKNCIYSLGLLLLVFLMGNQVYATSENPSANETYPFIENKGQVIDQNGFPRNDVRYLYERDGFKLILRNTGFSYEFTKVVPDNGSNTESGQLQQSMDEEEDVVIPDMHFVSNRIDVELKNCNTNALITAESSSPFYTNYFNGHTGPCGITCIHSFTKVIYKNIYDGIDLVFYTKQQPDGKIFPEYEFVVSPAGNMSNILLSYSGEDHLSLTNDGILKLNSELGYIHESRPVILFADGSSSRQGSFVMNGTLLSFKNVKHAKDQTIIIDPTIAWGTYYGGTGKDIPDEIASDSQSNIYLTGRTHSTSLIATVGAQKVTYSGGDDAVVIKFDGAGNLVWATYHGGSGNDVAFAITIDAFDNIYIGGRTVSPDGIATPGAVIDTVSGGLFDVFLAKFNSDGMLQWGTYMGGDLKDEVQGLATNAEGDLYVSGYSESLYGISTPGSYKSVGDTAGESFLMKFSPEGHQLWGTYYGGIGRDRGHGVWVNNGHVYQTGTTNSKTGIATTGSFQDQYTKLLDAFLAEWTEDGQLVWGTYIGGEGDDRPRDVRTDDDGNLYVVGQTESTTKISTPGTWKTTLQYLPGKNRDGFVEKFTADGARVWGTYFGGNHIEMPRGIRVGRLGTPIWIGGYTKSDSGLATKDGYGRKLGGGNDGFLAKLNWNGSKVMYSTYYGGGKSESITEGGWYGSPMDVAADGSIYLASCTTSVDSIATSGAYKVQLADTGQYDYFITKFTDLCSDPFEPNDSTAIVPSLPFNPATNSISLKAMIQKKNDKDYFIVRLKPGMTNMTIILANLPIDCNLFLYDSSLHLLAKSQNTGLTNDTILVTDGYAGKYYVLVKNPSGSQFDATNCYTLTISASAISRLPEQQQNNSSNNNNVVLYPNPSNDVAELVVTCKQEGTCHVEIHDLMGRLLRVMNTTVTGGENTIDLPVQTLSAGSYMVSVISEEQQQTLKMEIQR